MKIFPSRSLKFKLMDDKERTLERLNRKTEYSKTLTSQLTDKSFRGIVDGHKFKIISSAIGKGALCVMAGEIKSDKGHMNIEFNKGFKILFGIFLFFPIIGIVALFLSLGEDFSPIMILVSIIQVAMIRFIFISLAFYYTSKESLNRFRDVLDIEWLDR